MSTNYDLSGANYMTDFKASFDRLDRDLAVAFRITTSDGGTIDCGNVNPLTFQLDFWNGVGSCELIPIMF